MSHEKSFVNNNTIFLHFQYLFALKFVENSLNLGYGRSILERTTKKYLRRGKTTMPEVSLQIAQKDRKH